mmetsp:Transcript_39043/g.48363  ORF Transcript_39043/g.48363 Transcript_39043/m.48363 type:complete len:144 (-) Transcript_39043:50-481(-)
MGQVLDTCCGGGETGADATADVVPGLVPGMAGTAGGGQISASSIKSLKDMGFDEVAARNALDACNGNLEQATQLLLSSSMAEPEPVVDVAPMAPMAAPRSEQSPEKISKLMDMGFTEQQAHDALDGYNGNLERAIEHLMTSAQ